METQERTYGAQVARPANEKDLAEWYEKRGIRPDADGVFTELPYRGEDPAVDRTQILENVKVNAARRDVPNLHPREYTPKTMVYVGGGPTLSGFLDEIKAKCEDEKYDVITSNRTCSWLLSRGIKPNYHLILDPQQKKIKDLEYLESVDLLLGVQCHPDLFERAKEKGVKVEKFLALSSAPKEGEVSDVELARAAVHEGDQRLLGFGGGSMTGTRMIYFAGSRGYRRLEYYGFDGHVAMENNVVRCYAYQKFRGENIIETEAPDGRKFFTTMALLRQYEEMIKLYDQYPGIDIEIYGDSLLSHALKLYKAHRKQATYRISPEYLAMLRKIHADKNGHLGVIGGESAPRVFLAAAQLAKKHGACEVLDYGCGKGFLVESIKRVFPEIPSITYREYDPAIPGLDKEPSPADLVFCGDVMEHVEPECIDNVFRHISELTKRVAIFIIALEPAVKTLPDGRNAHISLNKPDWWLSYIRKYFAVIESQKTDCLTVACKKLP